MTELTPEIVRKLLNYDPETGVLTWKTRSIEFFADGGHAARHNMDKWNSKYAGKPALTSRDGHGYKTGRIFRKYISAHKAAWAIFYGVWPSEQIDHINHIRDDNRIANLRAVSRRQNMKNQSRKRNNTSGVTGVRFDEKQKKWKSQITVDGKNLNLGFFEDFGDACLARMAAEKKHGFHKNHGRA